MRRRHITAESRHPRAHITAPPPLPQLTNRRHDPHPFASSLDHAFVATRNDPLFLLIRRGHTAAPQHINDGPRPLLEPPAFNPVA
jgi:hypothetical protein